MGLNIGWELGGCHANLRTLEEGRICARRCCHARQRLRRRVADLGIVRRQDPMTEMVAKKLVELASAGMRDPDHLKAQAVQAFSEPFLRE
jgi:hypothetical protein